MTPLRVGAAPPPPAEPGPDAQAAILQAMADAGWLEWERRYEELDGRRGVRGPQVEQTTNLYRVLDPPAKAVALVAAGTGDSIGQNQRMSRWFHTAVTGPDQLRQRTADRLKPRPRPTPSAADIRVA